MYTYRNMTLEERTQILARRKERGFPWHAPPHYSGEINIYLISAACFEHYHIMATPNRLTEFSEALIGGMESDLKLHSVAWVVQPNHYHVLVKTDLDTLRPWLGRLHNGKSTQWNREDKMPGRKVWHRFTDRRIRSERHFYATLNYIHANPVKHGYVEESSDWPWSSLHDYLTVYGRDTLVQWWNRYPIKDYGTGWDD
ncbi:REP-associated tyrosine transposase [Desulfosudis oleivorans]|uniref:Transposase IS200-like domain-containing protein n=1 Tax=Desulfosudis oleivorans (strain DSM 6200 / JCM 39069 / Hxd3) TaxID=96561 RepID=A9A0W3_DESOH|nr:hypothetical protein [Desulfosudis oleivorans]ABW67588.1 hypothetical protein Dole_1784 [Desulfosudis oleivorans Hxd3]